MCIECKVSGMKFLYSITRVFNLLMTCGYPQLLIGNYESEIKNILFPI